MEQLVGITELAIEKVQEELAKDHVGKGLRLGVKGGGCSGLSYAITFDNKKERDQIIEVAGFEIYLDPKSAIYLKGTVLDFEGGLEGKGFVFKNPNASNTCGCGESFSI